MDKKGQWGQAPTLLDWIAYIVLIIAIILSLIIFTLESEKVREGAGVVSVNQEKGYFMLNYLKSNVSSGNVAELIAKWYIDDSGESELFDATDDIVNFFYGGKNDWELSVDGKKLGTLDFISKSKKIISRDSIENKRISIPVSFNQDDVVLDVKLSVYIAVVEEGSLCWNALGKACSSENRLCKCDRVGFSLRWTECLPCSNGCDPLNGVCSGENVVVEGERCYNLRNERCTKDNRLCSCDGFKWKNCQSCSNGCNQVSNECK